MEFGKFGAQLNIEATEIVSLLRDPM